MYLDKIKIALLICNIIHYDIKHVVCSNYGGNMNISYVCDSTCMHCKSLHSGDYLNRNFQVMCVDNIILKRYKVLQIHSCPLNRMYYF